MRLIAVLVCRSGADPATQLLQLVFETGLAIQHRIYYSLVAIMVDSRLLISEHLFGAGFELAHDLRFNGTIAPMLAFRRSYSGA